MVLALNKSISSSLIFPFKIKPSNKTVTNIFKFFYPPRWFTSVSVFLYSSIVFTTFIRYIHTFITVYLFKKSHAFKIILTRVVCLGMFFSPFSFDLRRYWSRSTFLPPLFFFSFCKIIIFLNPLWNKIIFNLIYIYMYIYIFNYYMWAINFQK